MAGEGTDTVVTNIEMSSAEKTQFADNMKGAFAAPDAAATTTTTTDTTNKGEDKGAAATSAAATDYTPFAKELGFENVDALKAKLAAEGTPDYNKYLKETFGIEDVDSAKAALEKAQQLETILPEYNTLKNQTLTPFAKIANELEQKGVKPSTIARFHGLDLNSMSDEEALALSEEVKTPQLKKAQIDAIIEDKYGVADELLTDNQKAVRDANKTKDAAIARGELSKYIAEVFNPSVKSENPELAARENARASHWQSNIGKVDEGNFKLERPLKVTVPDRQGNKEIEMNFNYTVAPETKAVILNDLKTMIASNPDLFTADGKGMDNANAYVRNRMFALEGNKIVQQFIEHTKTVESKINEHYATLLHNPIHRDIPQNLTAKTTAKEEFNKNAEGGLSKVTG